MKSVLIATLAAAAMMIPLAAMAEGTTMAGHSKAPAQTKADAAYAASMATMMSRMDVKPSHDPDKDFVSMMMPHHQGAIDMAKVELQYGKDPMLRALADDIVKAQEKEIAAMQAWQARHGR